MTENSQTLPAKHEAMNLSIGAGEQNKLIIQIKDYSELRQAGEWYYKSGLAPDSFKNGLQVSVGIGKCMELGIPWISGMEHMAIINGKTSVFGKGALAIVRGSGLMVMHKEWTEGTEYEPDWTFFCEVQRKGEPNTHLGEFSWEDAIKAGFDKPKRRDGSPDTYSPWARFPKRMCKWRARYVIWELFSDLLHGMSVAEDLIGAVDMGRDASGTYVDATQKHGLDGQEPAAAPRFVVTDLEDEAPVVAETEILE